MTAVVRSDSQGIGIGYHLGTRMFIDAVRSFHGRPFVMAGRFFNPLGAQAIRKLVSDGRYVYPQIGSDSRPTEQLVQSANIREIHWIGGGSRSRDRSASTDWCRWSESPD